MHQERVCRPHEFSFENRKTVELNWRFVNHMLTFS